MVVLQMRLAAASYLPNRDQNTWYSTTEQPEFLVTLVPGSSVAQQLGEEQCFDFYGEFLVCAVSMRQVLNIPEEDIVQLEPNSHVETVECQ